MDTPESRKAFTAGTPEESLVSAAEVYLELIEPIEGNDTLLQAELDKRVDEVLVTQAHICGRFSGIIVRQVNIRLGEEMERQVEEAKKRRKEKQSLKEDVDRNRILRFAKVRKVCLFLLAQFATSAGRCDIMINRKEKSLLSAEKPASVVPLCFNILSTMAMFDVEAANTAINLLRNFCLSHDARKKVLKQVEAKKLGETLLSLVKNQNYNTACVAAAIIRFFCSERDLNTISEMFPVNTLMDAVSMDTTKMHPVVRVELARALSHILYTVATQAKGTELHKKLFRVEVVTLMAYLLQSEYCALVAECLDALDKCPDDLLKNAGEKVPLYFAKEDIEGAVEEEDIDKQLAELEKLEITEEDTNMEDQSEKKDKKEEVVTIKLKTRLESIANGKVALDEALPKEAATILERIVDRIK